MSKRILSLEEQAELFGIFQANGGVFTEQVCRRMGASFKMPPTKIQKWCYRQRSMIKKRIQKGGTVSYPFFYNISDAKKDQPERTRASPSASNHSEEGKVVKQQEEPQVEQFPDVFRRFNVDELQNILCAANLKEFQYLLANGKFSLEPAPGGGREYYPTELDSPYSMPTPTASSVRKSHSRSSASSSPPRYTDMKTCVLTSSPELSPIISHDPSFVFGTS